MDIASLIAALSDPRAYPFAVTRVDVHQTHISAVFLAGDLAYKLKKPVHLPFLDFSTLALRRKFCDEELRLNRRLAPDVYLDVVPITADGSHVCFEGSGTLLDWAVKMRRLPESATLEHRVLQDEVHPDEVCSLARRLAGFHSDAAASAQISAFGHFDVVARNIRENFDCSASTVGRVISPAVRDRLMSLTEQALHELRPLIDARAARDVPRDTHGDLHLDHVYLFPDRPPPGDLVIVDCIEFNERFRCSDPVADMAFLVMDLNFHGRRDLGAAFADAYFEACGDAEGRRLLPLYTSYRAAVRGKVDGLQLDEPEIPESDRADAARRARGHWLQALDELEAPGRRPCLVLVGGLPGTGKSTLARNLARQADFQLLRSDVVRKELAGRPVDGAAAPIDAESIYTPEWTNRTYAACLARAEQLLFQGQRVIVDATFIEERRRRQFLDAAVHWGIPALFLVCEAQSNTVQPRLAARRGDASDADWNVYLQAAQHWEEPGARTRLSLRNICSDASPESALEQAVQSLMNAGLYGTRPD